jgi:hypothetical protein
MRERLDLYWRIGAVCLLLGALAAFVWYVSPSQQAQRSCSTAVLRKLRSPSTAQFGHSSYESKRVTRSGFEVRGWVDAANAYGTPIRNYYLCLADDSTNIEVHFSEREFLPYYERLSQGRGPI